MNESGHARDGGVSVIIPIFNEPAEAIRGTIGEVHDVLASLPVVWEIIIVDDGSEHETAMDIDAVCATWPDVHLIRNPYNLGYSASLKRGIKKAVNEIILITDADGSYPAKGIPDILARMDGFDMVVGSRTGRQVEMQPLRGPVRHVIRWLAMILTGRSIPDLNSGMRAFHRSLAMEFFHLLPSRFSFTITMTLACLTNDYTIDYVPIDYHRRLGRSSIRPVQDTLQFLFLVFRIVMYFKPLRFFLLPACLLLLLGCAYLFWGIAAKNDILDGAIMLIVVGFQILFTGFLADIITKQKIRS